MKLSRRIPAHTHTEKYNWCRKDYFEMSPRFRAIRSKSRNKLDKCHWCKHHFADGEKMAIAQPVTGRNTVLCPLCADVLLATKEE